MDGDKGIVACWKCGVNSDVAVKKTFRKYLVIVMIHAAACTALLDIRPAGWAKKREERF